MEQCMRALLRRMLDWLFKPWMKPPEVGPLDWQSDVQMGMQAQQGLRARGLLYAIALTMICLLVWSAFAEIDEVTRGNGKVIPSQQVQIIQSQDGGVVTQILTQEGQVVTKGQLLIRLDRTRSESSFNEKLKEFEALSVKEARLRAVVDKVPFVPTQALIDSVPRIVAQEKAIYQSSQQKLASLLLQAELQLTQRKEESIEITAKIKQLQTSLGHSQKELALTKPMLAKRAVSEVQVLRLEKEVDKISDELPQAQAQIRRVESAIEEARSKIEEIELVFVNEVREELTFTLSRLNELGAINTALSDRVTQTEIRSPVSGTVKQLYYNTIGGVVMPGREIVEVVPLDDTLLMEVRIQPKDIAFLIKGQTSLVKFSAYDFIVYGGLEGTVERVGADTIMDEDGNPYYEVNVRTGEPDFGRDKPIIPGMTVEVDILTGKKTILAYLMKPVLRAKQYSLTER
ncbi:MAG: HlyD family type I secretion periplasmic adaptor subunit [Gammaproteobacteria bacterium]|nr:HlyD family type I secretion periplasmic adaptor subunit [Gammaproteobacteria bacterium]MBT5203686.1 HlyD family type I secretion periplasmic adaptor subunit [Gammaproteobacteria bacterium]MBT5601851.1 HlyD family type I secretion periplasmic adaptor subunit [Gammaproteobacteria bacterium]MBT6246110.1 HlyD family type I secretion periplasmic adaptor subunit [Gammaproteobacteria bacterium]